MEEGFVGWVSLAVLQPCVIMQFLLKPFLVGEWRVEVRHSWVSTYDASLRDAEEGDTQLQ